MGLFKRKGSRPTYPHRQSPDHHSIDALDSTTEDFTSDSNRTYTSKAPRIVTITETRVDLTVDMAIKRSTVKVPGPPDPHTKPAEYLRSLHAVRQRSRLVFQKAKCNKLMHFRVDMSKFDDTVNYVVSIIKVS